MMFSPLGLHDLLKHPIKVGAMKVHYARLMIGSGCGDERWARRHVQRKRKEHWQWHH